MKDEIKNELVVPFTIVPNDILNDPLLSLKQKGMLCYLISLPKGWVVYKSELENHFTDGRESISNALEDLVQMGFVSKVENKKEKGKFQGFTYTVLPLRVIRNGFTATDNPQLINTNSNNTNKVNLNINAELKNSAEIDKESSIVKAKPLKEKKQKKGPDPVGNFNSVQATALYGEVKKSFLELYLEKYKSEYYFEPKNAAKVYSLIRKVLFKMKEAQHREDFTIEEVASATSFFLIASYATADSWLGSNFNLSNIDSKFNDIYSKIKAGKHGNTGTSLRESEAAARAARFKKTAY